MNVATEDILALVKSALNADYTGVRRVGNRIAMTILDEDRETGSRLLAELRRSGVPLKASGQLESVPVDSKSRLPLLDEQCSPSTPLFLDEAANETFGRMVEEVTHANKLKARGLPTRFNLILSGPPGTGKSLLAAHLAERLNRPLYLLRVDSLISSLLGDTAKNIRSAFDFAAARSCVIFLDEFDAVGKVRDDVHDVGELRRVVNTVLQGLDAADDSTVVVAATNHPHLLDSALWRRFPYKIAMSLPEATVRQDMWRHHFEDCKLDDADFEVLTKLSDGWSGADIETVAQAVLRTAVLRDHDVRPAAVFAAVLRERFPRSPKEPADLSKWRQVVAHHLIAALGVTKSEAAKVLGVSRQTIHQYLRETVNGECA